MSLNGTFYDATKNAPSGLHPAAFNPTDLKGKALQTYLSDYVLNTGLLAGF